MADWVGFVLLGIVFVGFLVWLADWVGWTDNPRVSKGYNVCARCPRVIRPGQRIRHTEQGEVVHMYCI